MKSRYGTSQTSLNDVVVCEAQDLGATILTVDHELFGTVTGLNPNPTTSYMLCLLLSLSLSFFCFVIWLWSGWYFSKIMVLSFETQYSLPMSYSVSNRYQKGEKKETRFNIAMVFLLGI